MHQTTFPKVGLATPRLPKGMPKKKKRKKRTHTAYLRKYDMNE